MTKRVRVNIQTTMNTKGLRKEKRNGRDVIIIPSATLPDGVIMNGIRYPAEEIEKSFHTLERTPAPFGHPMINGQFVSARDPEGINIGHVGAWNENVRRDKGRVFLDKVIDVEVANRCENGKRLLDAINEGKPIHTSTGLLANLVETGEKEPKWDAADMFFDHDAILLDEEGAATPEQGVGMFVNGQQIEVINSRLEEQLDEEMNWMVDSIVRTLEKQARLPLIERIKTALVEAFSTGRETSREQENADMANENEKAENETRFSNLEKGLADMAKTVEGLGTVVANAIAEALKPVTTTVETLSNAQKAQEEAAKTVLVNKIVEAGVLSKESAEAMPAAALAELANKVQPGKAAPINPAFQGNAVEDEFKDYDLNAAIDAATKKESV